MTQAPRSNALARSGSTIFETASVL